MSTHQQCYQLIIVSKWTQQQEWIQTTPSRVRVKRSPVGSLEVLNRLLYREKNWAFLAEFVTVPAKQHPTAIHYVYVPVCIYNCFMTTLLNARIWSRCLPLLLSQSAVSDTTYPRHYSTVISASHILQSDHYSGRNCSVGTYIVLSAGEVDEVWWLLSASSKSSPLDVLFTVQVPVSTYSRQSLPDSQTRLCNITRTSRKHWSSGRQIIYEKQPQLCRPRPWPSLALVYRYTVLDQCL